MDPLPNAFAYAGPYDPPLHSGGDAAPELAEERWPIGLSVVFVIASSILLWLPIIACVRWLL